ncbi:hypothetical protein [Paenibacillus piri]|uniref:Uncharacterized protein n=1 Tax=Paenibacillus piri TaxID=2547395 RepID=A0A4R5KDI0_9BACL|nr:hypothetical protein [Paenibacillus piri]TDF92150.1 hypothetical protein E1757_30615 [Paenibacillus piri]
MDLIYWMPHKEQPFRVMKQSSLSIQSFKTPGCLGLSASKPMRLNLKFEVAVRGNEMSGSAKAGMLPASKVSSVRAVSPGRKSGAF